MSDSEPETSRVPQRWSGPIAFAIVAVSLVLGALRTVPCLNGGVDTRALWTTQCYSDIPLFYVGHGLHLDFGWFGGADSTFPAIEYPALTALFIEAMAKLTHGVGLLTGTRTAAGVGNAPEDISRDAALYLAVTCVALIGAGMIATYFLGRLVPRRLWVACAALSAPLLFLEATVNWDLLALLAVAIALVAWQRGRYGWFGVAVGAGVALKLYPVLLLGAAVAIGLRRRQMRAVLLPIGTASLCFLLVNAPAATLNFDRWLVFWTLNGERKADFGSVWVVLRILGYGVPTGIINGTYLVGMILASLIVLAISIKARREPGLAELSLILTIAFVVLNKVYSPQYSLWLLPLVLVAMGPALAVRAWVVAEVCYFVSIWHHIVRVDLDHVQGVDRYYLLAIAIRVLLQVGLALLVVRALMQHAEPDGRSS